MWRANSDESVRGLAWKTPILYGFCLQIWLVARRGLLGAACVDVAAMRSLLPVSRRGRIWQPVLQDAGLARQWSAALHYGRTAVRLVLGHAKFEEIACSRAFEWERAVHYIFVI